MITAENDSRIKEYDILRIIAIFFVLFGHALLCSMCDNYGTAPFTRVIQGVDCVVPSVLNLQEQALNFIYSFHMPLFMMLSGALLSLGKNIKTVDFIKKKAKRLLIPWVAITLLYLIPLKAISGFYNSGIDVFRMIIDTLFCKTVSHLWFLPILFLTLPHLTKWDSRIRVAIKPRTRYISAASISS